MVSPRLVRIGTMGYPASYTFTSKSDGFGTGVGFSTDVDAVFPVSYTGFRDFGSVTVVGFS